MLSDARHLAIFFLVLFAEAEKARDSLSGRLFAGRTVHAEFFDQALFDAGQLSG